MSRAALLRSKPRVCALAVALACGAALAQQPAPSVVAPQAAASAPVTIISLGDLYRQALPNEAKLKAADAAFRSSSEQLPQAQSQIRPQVQATSTRFRNQLDSTVPGLVGTTSTTENYNSSNDTLQLRQPLYRPQQWAAIKSAGHVVEAARAQRDQEMTAFAQRVALAYFDGVLSSGQVQYAKELVEALRIQLSAAQRLFAAGTGTRTDVDEVQAQLDSALADQIEAQQYQAYASQQLAVLLAGRPAQVPALRLDKLDVLLPDAERDIAAWLERARTRSAEIRQLQEQLAAAREDIARAEAGHKPTLDLVLQRQRTSNDNVTRLRSTFDNTSLGVQLNLPIYGGGLVSSQVRQALADVDKNQYALEALQVDLDSRVRREHRSVIEGAARHRALLQAATSSRTALSSAERSYQAGVRTRIDIARATQRVAQLQRDLLQAACQTLLARVRLELLASGTQEEVDAAMQWVDRVIR